MHGIRILKYKTFVSSWPVKFSRGRLWMNHCYSDSWLADETKQVPCSWHLTYSSHVHQFRRILRRPKTEKWSVPLQSGNAQIVCSGSWKRSSDVGILVYQKWFWISCFQRGSQSSLQLQMAPSLEHQTAAMLSILERYKWHQFSVVTSQIAGHDDFIQAVRERITDMQDRFK